MKWLRRFCLVAGLTTALFAAPLFAQVPSPLQIAITNGNAMLSWPNSNSICSLQTTTSLSPPVQWGSKAVTYGGGIVNFPVNNPQQFFRLANAVPVFQFEIFYNLDLDIAPGQTMVMNGPVFANGNIWMWPYATINFSNFVAAAGTVNAQEDPNNQESSDGYVAPTYIPGQPVSHMRPLVLLVAATNAALTNLSRTILNLPPPNVGAPNPAAYSPTGQVYLYNAVDLIISNSASGLPGTHGTNITIWYQDTNNVTALTQLLPNTTNGFGTGVTNRFFSFVTNVQFFDFRESDTVQAVQIDVAKLNVWLTNTTGTGGNQYNQQSFANKSHGIDSIFIYNNVPQTASQLPAVRLINGQQLPYTVDPGGSGLATGGLTVATPMPLYVKGNYNVQTATSSAGASAGTTNMAYTYPAALMGDAITILSGNWLDSYFVGTSLSSRSPVSTTINAACLAGIVQSTNSGGNNYYSGGLENFLRLEENWAASYTLTYNGSIVVMFPSIYATNFWQVPGNYYNPPMRQWNFDLNFTVPSKLPPLTPTVANFISP